MFINLHKLVDILKYKKVLIQLAVFELIRGFLIILIAWLIQFGIRNAEFGITLFAILSVRILIESYRLKRFNTLSLNFQKELRQKLHRQLFVENANTINSGELLTLMFDTVEAFDDFFVRVLPNMFTIAVLIPLILLVSLMIDPLTALIFLLTLPIAPFLLYLIGNAISQRNQQALKELSKLNFDFKELIAAITTLKIFKQSETALSRLKSTSEQSATATLEVLKLAFVSAFALELITTLSIALIAVTVGLRLVDDSISFEVALFLLILAPEFYSPIRQIGAAFHAAIKAKDALINLECRMQNVELEYNNSKISNSEFLIMDFALTVVVGESGSGKSTLIKALVQKYMQKNKAVAYLPQQPHLFKTSIRNNVTLFKNIDDELVLKVLNDVGLSFNLDYKVEGLSRGQLQRLGLARVLISLAGSAAPIIILDEPTAALDVNTKQLIINIIYGLRQKYTLIIATHDAELISLADEIINLDDFI